MTTTTRDPRNDPMPGDVLEWPGQRRSVTRIEYGFVYYTVSKPYEDPKRTACDYCAWRRWAKVATVVNVAEPQEQTTERR